MSKHHGLCCEEYHVDSITPAFCQHVVKLVTLNIKLPLNQDPSMVHSSTCRGTLPHHERKWIWHWGVLDLVALQLCRHKCQCFYLLNFRNLECFCQGNPGFKHIRYDWGIAAAAILQSFHYASKCHGCYTGYSRDTKYHKNCLNNCLCHKNLPHSAKLKKANFEHYFEQKACSCCTDCVAGKTHAIPSIALTNHRFVIAAIAMTATPMVFRNIIRKAYSN